MKTMLEKIKQQNFQTEFKDVRYMVKGLIDEAVAVDINNILEWLDIEKPRPSDLKAITPQRLPFESMWLEFRMKIEHEDGSSTMGKGGILLMDPKEQEDEHSTMALVFREDEGSPYFVLQFELTSNDNGRTVADIKFKTEVISSKAKDQLPTREQREAVISGYASIAMAALTFFSCKNIRLVPTKMNQKARKKLLQEKGVRLQDFHVIEIHKFMTKTESSPSKGGTSVATAHLVRGHFKNFGPDKKLLGRFEGTYFWHPHVRGGPGPVHVSNYRVWPPQDDHNSNCILPGKRIIK
jgi:hypothetical protein